MLLVISFKKEIRQKNNQIDQLTVTSRIKRPFYSVLHQLLEKYGASDFVMALKTQTHKLKLSKIIFYYIVVSYDMIYPIIQ